MAEEARKLLFEHDPTAQSFVQGIEKDMDQTSTNDKLDVLCYMSAVLELKEKIGELIPVKEYVDQRKRARVEEVEALGVNSPRPK